MNGYGARQLHLAVNEVGQVGELQMQTLLLPVPRLQSLRLVIDMIVVEVVELDTAVDQLIPNGLR